jgi:hypothetical protein
VRRGSSVTIVMIDFELDDRDVGVRVQLRSRIFNSPNPPDGIWGLISPLAKCIGCSFSRSEDAAGEVGQSLRSSTEVKKTWVYPSIHPHAFIIYIAYFIKYKDNLTFFVSKLIYFRNVYTPSSQSFSQSVITDSSCYPNSQAGL